MARAPKALGKNAPLTREAMLLALADRQLAAGPPGDEMAEERLMPTVELLLQAGHADTAVAMLPLFSFAHHSAAQHARIAVATGDAAQLDAALAALDTLRAGFSSPVGAYEAMRGGRAVAEVALAAEKLGHDAAAALWTEAEALAEASPANQSAWPRLARALFDAGRVDAALAVVAKDSDDSSGRAVVAAALIQHFVQAGTPERVDEVMAVYAEVISTVTVDEALLAARMVQGPAALLAHFGASSLYRGTAVADLAAQASPALDGVLDWLIAEGPRHDSTVLDLLLARGQVGPAETMLDGRDRDHEGWAALALAKGDPSGALARLQKTHSAERIIDSLVALSARSPDFAREVALPQLAALADGSSTLVGWVPDTAPALAKAAAAVVLHGLDDPAAGDTLKAAFAMATALKRDDKETAVMACSAAWRRLGDPLLAFKACKKMPAGRQKSAFIWEAVALDYALGGDLGGAALVIEACKEESERIALFHRVLVALPLAAALEARGYSAADARRHVGQRPQLVAWITGAPRPWLAPVSGFSVA